MQQENLGNQKDSSYFDSAKVSEPEILDFPLSLEFRKNLSRFVSAISVIIDKPQPYKSFVRQSEPVKKIDISVLKQNIEFAVEASEKVKNKEAIFVVGKTGAEKSTIIHFLAGVKLNAQDLKENVEINHLNSDQESQQIQQIQDEEIQKNDDSLINDFVLVPEEELQQIAILVDLVHLIPKCQTLVLDTKGVVYDIVNAIGLEKAYSSAKNVRFVLAVAEATVKLPKGVDLRSLISQFLGYLPDMPMDELLPSLTVIISRSITKKDSLISQLQKTAKTKDQPNQRVIETVKEIHRKIKRVKGANNKHVKTIKFKTAVDYRSNTQKKLNDEYEILFIKVKSKFTDRKFDTHVQLKNLLNILAYLMELRFTEEYQKDVYDNIRKLPLMVNQLWQKYKYRQISNKLGQVKKIGSPESEAAFFDLSQLVKRLLKDKGQDIRIKINQQDLRKLMKIYIGQHKPENQMKGILAFDYKKMQHKVIVKEVCQKIQKQIVEVAKKKLDGKQISQVVEKIMELKKWNDKLPLIEQKIDQKIGKILSKAKEKKNLTGQIVAAVQKIASDPTSNNKQVIACKQIMHKYGKELSIPRILPKLRMTTSDAVNKFSGSVENQINKEQLRKVYDIFEIQSEKQKDKYIAKGSQQITKKNLQLIKDDIGSYMKQV